MCCSDPPPPPDLGPMAEASAEQARVSAQIAQDQLAWAREQDTMNREILNQVLDIQLPAMREQFEQAQSDRERYETLFRPMEDRFVQEAQEYDTPERQAQARARAIADVSTQFDAQRRNALQRLEGYGVDPSQTRNAALDVGVRTAQAAAQAGAAQQAGQRVEDIGREMRAQAINLGRGALAGAGQFYGGAVQAGQAGVAGAGGTTGASTAAFGTATPWGGMALQGYGQSADILSQGYGNQMMGYEAQSQQQAGMLQGLGSIVGGIAAIQDGGPVAEAPTNGVVIEGEYSRVQDPMGEVEGPGDGSGIDDQIPAMLSDGEYVIPADVVRAKGEEFFDKLLERYHVPAAQQRQQQQQQRAIG